MAEIRLVHAADFHIGKPGPAYLGPEKGRIRKGEMLSALKTTLDVCRSEGARIMLISGDLFEHTYCRLPLAREVMSLFESNPDVRVFIAPGNHDPYVRDSFYATLRIPANVHVFVEPSVRHIVLGEPGIVISGLAWTRFEEPGRLLSGYRSRGGYPEVLLVHGEFQREGRDSRYLPVHFDDVAPSGVDYLALGHVHNAVEFECGKTCCAYPGSPEPLDFGEEGEHGVYVVTLTGNSVRTRFMPVARRRVHRISLDITGADTLEKVIRAIASVGAPSSRKSDLWEVTLTGRPDPHLDLDPDEITQRLAGEFFYVRIVPDVVPDYDLATLADPGAEGLEGRFARAVLDELNRARALGDEVRARILRKALYYGLDAMRLGRVVRRGVSSEGSLFSDAVGKGEPGS